MSFFSRSRSRGHYPNPNWGQSHYKRGGLFGRFGFLSGSFGSRSRDAYPPYPQQGYQPPMAGQNYPQQQQNYPQQNYQPQPQQQNGLQNTGATVCPNCGTAVPANSKFCMSCGQKMNAALFCPECGKQIPAGSKFCLECGHKIG